MKYQIYTDGGITFATKVGSFALVILDPEGRLVAAYGKRCLNTTSNQMEMWGVLNALRWAAKYPDREVEVLTDSQYVCNGVTEWMHKWRSRGWFKPGGEILNLSLWKRMYRVKLTVPHVKVNWVRGHAGNPHNELADQICTRCKQDLPWQDLLEPFRKATTFLNVLQ